MDAVGRVVSNFDCQSMESVVSSVRAAMYAILVATLLVCWGIVQTPPSAVDIGLDVYKLLKAESERGLQRLPARANNLIKDMEVSRVRGDSDRKAIGSVLVPDILSCSDFGLLSFEKFTPEETKLAQQFLLDLATKDASEFEQEKEPYLRLIRSSRLRQYHDELAHLFTGAGGDEGVTLEELDKRLALRIKLPFVEERVERPIALILLSVGMIGLFLYCLSTIGAIEVESQFATDRKGADWLFFHPGRLGIALGSAWLISPCVALFCTWIRSGIGDTWLLIVSLILGGFGLAAIRRASCCATRVHPPHKLPWEYRCRQDLSPITRS
jgi:hypothetical protein